VSRRRGFSLVELLVVIGIISVLIGMLLPAVHAAQERARTTRCTEQLQQLGVALNNYASNNHGALPTWSSWQVAGGDGTGDDAPGPGWTEELAPYFASPLSQVYDCPGFPQDYPINYFLSSRWCHARGRTNIRLSDIKLSSEFVLSGDCTGPMLYRLPFGLRPFTTNDCDKDDAVDPALLFFGDPGGFNAHHGGNNVLFGDGHVSLLKHFEPDRMTFNPHRMQDWASVTAD
jgi:prepilin-type N-terminal cleavage/methylation domain-containing protein/prepilin-type processing-associated H-X9-DG protein